MRVFFFVFLQQTLLTLRRGECEDRLRMKQLIQQLLLFIGLSGLLTSTVQAASPPPFTVYLHDPWVNKQLSRMSVDEKIGQLFIVPAYSRQPQPDSVLLRSIRHYGIGGLLFMQGKAVNQVNLVNSYQQAGKVPLLVAMDAEWGPAFRLKHTPRYPVQMALGAIQQDTLIYQMGREVGEELKRLGVNINFAPVADVNNNPDNPVINYRSFGENPVEVARKAWLYAHGMQDAGILAVAKHFPGHGDTSADSHMSLPVVRGDTTRLNRIELYPFRYLINRGIGAVMTGHLRVPALEPDPTCPASLSSRIITGKLRHQYHFRGLIVTDAMNMHGVSDLYTPGAAAVKALQAGNDMLEFVPDLPQALQAVKQAIEDSTLSMASLNGKVRRILALKKWLKLDHYVPVAVTGLSEELQQPRYQLTSRLLQQESLTLLSNDSNLLPLRRLDTLKLAVVSLGSSRPTAFQQMASRYEEIDNFQLRKGATSRDIEHLVDQLQSYNLLLIGIHGLTPWPAHHYGTDPSIIQFLGRVNSRKKILVYFGNPYGLFWLPGCEQASGLLVTYQDNRLTEELAAQAIFGAIGVNGRLPVSVDPHFRLGDGLTTQKIYRLQYSIPEEVGLSAAYLHQKIATIANNAIRRKAFPGCQVIIVKDGQLIFDQCYGYLTYDSIHPLTPDAIYDWASLTKITGPLPALMKLYDEHKFKLDVPFSTYWPAFKGTDKARLTARQILAHQARLQPWIPFWENATMPDGRLKSSVFSSHPTDDYSLRVSAHLYERKDYKKEIYREIKASLLLPRARYTYSGLAFYLFPQIIFNLTGDNYESYLKKKFYGPLGASTVTYNGYKHYPLSRFVPTEDDESFRHEQLRGFVHDEGAAMMGGVSGNAGLFGTGNDLAKIMQMYLQYGYYGGHQFIDSATIKEFTAIQYPKNDNRRGLGFDKPYIQNYRNTLKNAYPAVSASQSSFGHSGYTGTFAWADPAHQLLFIFLSNRVYPTRNNSLIYTLNVRPAIDQVIYDAIRHGVKH